MRNQFIGPSDKILSSALTANPCSELGISTRWSPLKLIRILNRLGRPTGCLGNPRTTDSSAHSELIFIFPIYQEINQPWRQVLSKDLGDVFKPYMYIRPATNGFEVNRLPSRGDWIVRRHLGSAAEKEARCCQASPPCCSSSLLSFLTATARNLEAFSGLMPSC
jgi:hypothetical protein